MTHSDPNNWNHSFDCEQEDVDSMVEYYSNRD